MIKKNLQPLIVSAFIFVLVIGSLVHLCYCSSQTSKFHYMFQSYIMPEQLPRWMLGEFSFEKYKRIGYKYVPVPLESMPASTWTPDSNYLELVKYTGEWREWHRSGVLRHIGQYKNGVRLYSSSEFWNEQGVKFMNDDSPFYFPVQ